MNYSCVSELIGKISFIVLNNLIYKTGKCDQLMLQISCKYSNWSLIASSKNISCNYFPVLIKILQEI